jgi:hypothetical protein
MSLDYKSDIFDVSCPASYCDGVVQVCGVYVPAFETE